MSAQAATARRTRVAYDRARSRAVWAASQQLRERHRAEYQKLLTEALKAEGLA